MDMSVSCVSKPRESPESSGTCETWALLFWSSTCGFTVPKQETFDSFFSLSQLTVNLFSYRKYSAWGKETPELHMILANLIACRNTNCIFILSEGCWGKAFQPHWRAVAKPGSSDTQQDWHGSASLSLYWVHPLLLLGSSQVDSSDLLRAPSWSPRSEDSQRAPRICAWA